MLAYLDNSATTPVCDEAVQAMLHALREGWGNPSSLHQKGIEAEQLLEHARAQVAAQLHIPCDKETLVFTSGGTESNNLAILGAAYARRRYGRRIVSSAIEHASVEEALKQLEQNGFEVIRLCPDKTGRIHAQDLLQAVTPDTILVSLMSVNNETGTLQPVDKVKSILRQKRAPALFHCDAVQSFGKQALRPDALGVDLLTLSAHKIHGPKGVGALYIKKGVKLVPRTLGGTQENKLRPGTQAMPAIVGFGAAAEALGDPQARYAGVQALRDYMVDGLHQLGGIAVNSPADALAYVTNISVLGFHSEPLINALSNAGVCVSSGSACAKGKRSRVLQAMGLAESHLRGALRVSFSRESTQAEVDGFLAALAQAKQTLYGS